MISGNILEKPGLSRVEIGSVRFNSMTNSYQLFDGKNWITIDISISGNEGGFGGTGEAGKGGFGGAGGTGVGTDTTGGQISSTRKITDKYLEEQYTELKQLKKKYEKMRDKLKVFEILKQNDNE